MNWLTAEQVREVTFGAPPMGKRGYSEDEVDAFLDAIAAELADPGGRIVTAEQVSNVAFSKPPVGSRGYDEDDVDDFLARISEQLRVQQGGAPASQSMLSEFRPPPAGHAEEPDGFEQMFGIDRKSFLLAAAIGILAILGMALTLLSDRIPAMNEPAPSFVGPMFLGVLAVIIVIGFVRHFRNR